MPKYEQTETNLVIETLYAMIFMILVILQRPTKSQMSRTLINPKFAIARSTFCGKSPPLCSFCETLNDSRHFLRQKAGWDTPQMEQRATRSRSLSSCRNPTRAWSADNDALLVSLIPASGQISWDAIARHFPGKTAQQVADRWTKVLNPTIVKGSWTPEEDQAIMEWVRQHGTKNWSALAETMNGRLGKQCRERWVNMLDPQLVKKPWGQNEDQIIIVKQKEWGNKWSKIAELLPGRTDNDVKNRWNSSIKKKLERIGQGRDQVLRRGRRPKNPPVEEVPKPDFELLQTSSAQTKETSPWTQWSPSWAVEGIALSPGFRGPGPSNMSPNFLWSPTTMLFGDGDGCRLFNPSPKHQ